MAGGTCPSLSLRCAKRGWLSSGTGCPERWYHRAPFVPATESFLSSHPKLAAWARCHQRCTVFQLPVWVTGEEQWRRASKGMQMPCSPIALMCIPPPIAATPHCANEKGKEVLTKGSSYEHMHKSNPSRNNENTCSRSVSTCRVEPKRKLMHEAFYSTNYQRILVTKEK